MIGQRYIALSDGLELRRGDEVHVIAGDGVVAGVGIARRNKFVRWWRGVVISTLRIDENAPDGATFRGEKMRKRLWPL